MTGWLNRKVKVTMLVFHGNQPSENYITGILDSASDTDFSLRDCRATTWAVNKRMVINRLSLAFVKAELEL
jgi:hypothetical protein